MRDLDGAAKFLSEVLGCIIVYRAFAFGRNMEIFVKDQLNVHPRATVRGVAFLAQSARSCDFGQLEERCGNIACGIDPRRVCS